MSKKSITDLLVLYGHLTHTTQGSTCEYSTEPWTRLQPARTHMLIPWAHSLCLSLQAAASSAE
jgi:hypothetical protein